jgi:rSAM/selenodomain-associated transferase 1
MNAGTLILFAKYPTPGKVKTRLIPAVDAETAALLAESFLLDITDRIARSLDAGIRCVLCFDPPEARAAFCELLANTPSFLERFEFVTQRGNELGERLCNALADVRKTHSGPFVFIGTDAPDLAISEIETGVARSQNGSAFLTPATDGGYVLLALPDTVSEHVFENIAWSSRTTANDQIEQLKRCGIDTILSSATWPDVDEAADLKELEERLNANPSIAPRTHIVFKVCI